MGRRTNFVNTKRFPHFLSTIFLSSSFYLQRLPFQKVPLPSPFILFLFLNLPSQSPPLIRHQILSTLPNLIRYIKLLRIRQRFRQQRSNKHPVLRQGEQGMENEGTERGVEEGVEGFCRGGFGGDVVGLLEEGEQGGGGEGG